MGAVYVELFGGLVKETVGGLLPATEMFTTADVPCAPRLSVATATKACKPELALDHVRL